MYNKHYGATEIWSQYTRAKFAVGSDCMYKHILKYELRKTLFWVPEVCFKPLMHYFDMNASPSI